MAWAVVNPAIWAVVKAWIWSVPKALMAAVLGRGQPRC